MKSIEYRLERFMFASRWLLAPFYIGLVGAIAILLFKFVKEFITLLPQVFTLDGGQIMVLGIEKVMSWFGKTLSMAARERIQLTGLAIVLFLVVTVTFFDVSKMFGQ